MKETEVTKKDKNLSKELTDLGNNIALNRNARAVIGFDAAGLLAELVSLHTLFELRNQLTEDGYFYLTINTVQDMFNWKSDKQQKVFQRLVDGNLIQLQHENGGKRFIKLNQEEIKSLYGMHRKNNLPEKPETPEKPEGFQRPSGNY